MQLFWLRKRRQKVPIGYDIPYLPPNCPFSFDNQHTHLLIDLLTIPNSIQIESAFFVTIHPPADQQTDELIDRYTNRMTAFATSQCKQQLMHYIDQSDIADNNRTLYNAPYGHNFIGKMLANFILTNITNKCEKWPRF